MKIVINGKTVEVLKPTSLLEAARSHGIFIPSLCDHPGIEPFGGCRLCLVEIKGRKGLIPSCSLQVEEGMEVKTETPLIRKTRKEILNLILSEHPNACLICTEKDRCDDYKSTLRKVGEVTGCVLCSNNHRCDLQDVVEKVGLKKMAYPSIYRDFEVERRDPFFDRNMNLCILCGRCVRVCQEIRGAAAISFVFRGSKAYVGTALGRTLLESGCQMCGACVDICPTGSLSERSVKYEGMPDSTASAICPFCSVGCSLSLDIKDGKIQSSRPVPESGVNSGQACVRGRFVLKELMQSPQRITRPMVRKNGVLKEAGWDEALDFAAENIKKYLPGKIGFIASPHAAAEDLFAFRRFAQRYMAGSGIAPAVPVSSYAPIRSMAEKAGAPVAFNFRLDDLAEARTIVLAGGEIPASHPVAWVKILEAVRKGGDLIVLGVAGENVVRHAALSLRVRPGTEAEAAGYLADLISSGSAGDPDSGFNNSRKTSDGLTMNKVFQATGLESPEDLNQAAAMLARKGGLLVAGPDLFRGRSGKTAAAAFWNLSRVSGAGLALLGGESNLRGWDEVERGFTGKSELPDLLAGIRKGLLKALWLTTPTVLPEDSGLEFLIVQDVFWSECTDRADVVFPASAFCEREGIYVNMEGRIQKTAKILEPSAESRPDWWIVSQIEMRLNPGADVFRKQSAILSEMKKSLPGFRGISGAALERGDEFFIKEEKAGSMILPVSFPSNERKVSPEYPWILINPFNLDYYRGARMAETAAGMTRLRNPDCIIIPLKDAEEMNLAEGDRLRICSDSGEAEAAVQVSDTLPPKTAVAGFLWNWNECDAPFRLFLSEDEYVRRAISVRLEREKS